MGGSGMQWSFSNTNSQIVSFNSSQERGAAQHKLLSSAILQRNLSMEKQGGSRHHHHHHAYNSWQHNETLKHSSESRMFPLASQTAPMLSTPVVSPLNCPVVGSTDLRSSSNISSGPCQLTIFYNGSVCVYDNVSPDKAQAIMLLAGNGDSSKPNPTVPTAPKLQLQLSAVAVPKQPLLQSETAGVVSSSLSLGGFSSSISLAPPVNVAPLGGPVRPVPIPAHIKASEGPKSSPNLVPSAVPQARRASLARFLEKRKGRVVDAAPYPVSKNTSECSSAGPAGSPFRTNSANSSPLTTAK